ncbi:hypothetical protein ACVWWQ_001904 [Rhodanobacter sp. TND4EL1]
MGSNSRFLELKQVDDEMYSRVSLIDRAHVVDESHREAVETANRL